MSRGQFRTSFGRQVADQVIPPQKLDIQVPSRSGHSLDPAQAAALVPALAPGKHPPELAHDRPAPPNGDPQVMQRIGCHILQAPRKVLLYHRGLGIQDDQRRLVCALT